MAYNDPEHMVKHSHDWRIDLEIESVSNWSRMVRFVWVSVFCILIALSHLLFWQFLVVGLILFFVVHQKPSGIRHITQPLKIQDSRNLWFLYQQDKSDKDKLNLLQGRLLSTHVNRYLVVLNFKVCEPFSSSIYVVIWKDQVAIDAWHKLQAFTRL